MSEFNPCLACGACCAFYRASFYWAEADDATPGGVPVDLTIKVTDSRSMMIGTGGSRPYCIALKGIIGARVHCSIYENRSSSCRDFMASWYEGVVNERCDKAREAWGLLPITPESWDKNDRRFPRAA